VHGLTADVKEKAHKLTHSDQSKKKWEFLKSDKSTVMIMNSIK
jgi:hypothetical protein